MNLRNLKKGLLAKVLIGKLILSASALGCSRAPALAHVDSHAPSAMTASASAREKAPRVRRSDFFQRISASDVGEAMKARGVSSYRVILGHHSAKINLRSKGGHRLGNIIVRRSRGNARITVGVSMAGLEQRYTLVGNPLLLARTTLAQVLDGSFQDGIAVEGGAAIDDRVRALTHAVSTDLGHDRVLGHVLDNIEFSSGKHTLDLEPGTGMKSQSYGSSSVGDDTDETLCDIIDCADAPGAGASGGSSSVGDDSAEIQNAGDDDQQEEANDPAPVCDPANANFDMKDGVELTTLAQLGLANCIENAFSEYMADAWNQDYDITLTSGTRDAEEQAGAMFDNMEDGKLDPGVYTANLQPYVQWMVNSYNECEARDFEGDCSKDNLRDQWTAYIQSMESAGVFMSRHLTGQSIDIRTNDLNAEQIGMMKTYATLCGATFVTTTEGKKHLHAQDNASATTPLPDPEDCED